VTSPAPTTAEVLTAAVAEPAQRRAAGALLADGAVAGDRVVFCLPSSAALVCAVLGALRVGVVPVLLNATLTTGERDELTGDAEPVRTVLTTAELAALDAGPPVDLAPHPLARPMHYTSGTTGRSKGVWSGLWDEATAEAVFRDEADLWSFGPDDVHLVCSPLYHSVSVRFAAGTLLSGGTCIVLGRFEADVAADALRGRLGPAPTTAFMAPVALARLLDSLPAATDGWSPLGGLRLLVHAGSPCPPALKRRALGAVRPGALWEFYGSTEGQFTVCSPDEWRERPGTVGRARPGRRLAVDADGTIWCRPPPFASFAYWRDPVKTASAWRDGWFSVGDLGRLDDDGYLFIDGRRHDLIISGGVNVYPAEVEAVLTGVPGLAEMAVFGLPDDRWGQRVCAAVVTSATGPPGDVLEALRRRAATRLAPYKRPKDYFLLSALPRTATGKVKRHLLPAVVDGR
jgi:acyl-CoA synthetase (AMP-forming)/AMP-acid ligase II